MKTIWKYGISIFDHVSKTFEVPVGATFLSAGMDPGQFTSTLSLWFEVDPNAETEERTFVLIGTGHTVPDGHEYFATIVTPPLAVHVYESRP